MNFDIGIRLTADLLVKNGPRHAFQAYLVAFQRDRISFYVVVQMPTVPSFGNLIIKVDASLFRKLYERRQSVYHCNQGECEIG